ncbi:MAG: DUF1015 domain-containing protein [Blastocatellia bacterium]|nr:DUF1015 domain-containing protein [Blastocatellia bacterium]
MAIVKPFRALRPTPERAAEVAAVPYDVVNTEEALALAGDNPLSFLRVSRPEIEMPEGVNVYADEVYAKAATNFDRLIEQAPLIIEDEPSFYFYRLVMAGRAQTGMVACCSVDEYDNDIIRKHERTRKDKEDDRTRHMLAIGAQTGPVFLTHRPEATVKELAQSVISTEPLFDFVAPDKIAHTVWRAPAEMNQALIEAFGRIPLLYIADGHHRAKSASRAREALRAKNIAHTGDEEYNFFQCVIFPSDELHILPYNRVVKDLNHYSPEDFLKEVEAEFEITSDADPRPTRRTHFSMYLNGRWYGLKLKGEVTKRIKIADRLDVSALQNELLAPILGIQDVRTDKRIDFIGGVRGAQELERLVDSGKFAVAFSLYPTTLDELMEISDAGEIMPPKSTWFEPKLRDGLLSHLI